MIERTLAVIKPDAVATGHIGDIITRIEHKKLWLSGMELQWWSTEKATEFYREHQGKPFFPGLLAHSTSGACVAMVLAGEDAISCWRDLMGATDPKKAMPGTLRGLYGTKMPANAVHGSDSPESAAREIKLLFPDLA